MLTQRKLTAHNPSLHLLAAGAPLPSGPERIMPA
jgi:hypothetical protein